jgi:3-oxoacyl-[acyl-carrier protein] reductase
MTLFSLSGKKALITGASGGIGSCITKAYIDAGAMVAGSGSNAEKLQAEAAALGANFKAIAADLKDPAAPEKLITETEAALGGLDILVCNAGITRDGLALRMKDEQWQEVIDLNLTVNFKLARAAIKIMTKNRSGRIIFITSVVGTRGNAGQANYCASKAGLQGMAKALAHECATRGVTINCIAPGFIATHMTDVLNDAQKQAISSQIPMQRMGQPDEIAGGAVFLASPAADYMTGQTLHINGGMIMV